LVGVGLSRRTCLLVKRRGVQLYPLAWSCMLSPHIALPTTPGPHPVGAAQPSPCPTHYAWLLGLRFFSRWSIAPAVQHHTAVGRRQRRCRAGAWVPLAHAAGCIEQAAPKAGSLEHVRWARRGCSRGAGGRAWRYKSIILTAGGKTCNGVALVLELPGFVKPCTR
jgi:hypothetical protein